MSGISNIIDMINKKTNEKEQEIIGEAERHKRIKLEEAQKRAKEAADSIIKKAERDTKAELARYEAGAKLKAKYQMLEAKEELINSVFDKARKGLEDLPEKSEYKEVLKRLVVDAGITLNEEKLELVLPKGHQKYLTLEDAKKEIAKKTKKKVELAVSKETLRSIGGVLVRTADGSKWVDNTFEARMERMAANLRDRVASILFLEQKDK
jgi:V/A-type H+-transporting ATPase subunit E